MRAKMLPGAVMVAIMLASTYAATAEDSSSAHGPAKRSAPQRGPAYPTVRNAVQHSQSQFPRINLIPPTGLQHQRPRNQRQCRGGGVGQCAITSFTGVIVELPAFPASFPSGRGADNPIVGGDPGASYECAGFNVSAVVTVVTPPSLEVGDGRLFGL